MTRKITIEPVSRIEGHGKITIRLDEGGNVEDALLHVVEFRGFEKFCEGRPFTEMPAITARICGICPVSHLLASSKACDGILGVRPPAAATKLRRLCNFAQYVQSHALSFFHLSAPDFILGWDADPARRNVLGLAAADPELARKAIRLRQFGQSLIERLSGKKVHPAWTVPGGVRTCLCADDIAWVRAGLPESLATVRLGLGVFKEMLDKALAGEISVFGSFPSIFMGLTGSHGEWEITDGALRFVDQDGAVVADGVAAADYGAHIAEAVEPWSYLKFPYYAGRGYPDGIYRSGPLARLNVCDRIATREADAELAELRQRAGRIAQSSLLYHLARLIELLAALEHIDALIGDPELLSSRTRAEAGVNQLDAVGVIEAPRGTLIHDYGVDADGLIRRVNLIVATGHNNLAMNRTITQIARHYIRSDRKVTEGVLNRIEAGIRCYDPCLSCATHAVGCMPLVVEVVNARGELVDRAQRP